jgi:hydroxymethylpyrimidine pyrophosphatase-like HAD family hydrolase
VLCCGDGDNDYEIISGVHQAGGVGVAMRNATDRVSVPGCFISIRCRVAVQCTCHLHCSLQVKAAATIVVADNDAGGIKEALENFVL